MCEPARIVSINVSSAKGVRKHPVATAIVDGNGIVGDAHAGAHLRQLSLLCTQSLQRLAPELGRLPEPGELAENVTVQGTDFAGVALLDRLWLGPVGIEVTQIGKQCHGAGCAIYQQVGTCVMPEQGLFGRVLTGGELRPGLPVVHQSKTLRCRVITLSDRADRGEYADRSGPRAKQLLESLLTETPWPFEVDVQLLPDDAPRLLQALAAARQQGIDVVLTVGGTGVGPRDIAPETVTAFCDRLVPGIMEAVRSRFGAANPMARLSRSVAGTAGTMQIYALPGSVRAVDEYLQEVVKTIVHLVLMLHGLGHNQTMRHPGAPVDKGIVF